MPFAWGAEIKNLGISPENALRLRLWNPSASAVTVIDGWVSSDATHNPHEAIDSLSPKLVVPRGWAKII
jgi:hypothetical protein